MNITHKILKEKSIKSEKQNTNNAWGFNGAIKTVYFFENFEVHIGKVYFRHLPSENFMKLYDCKTEETIFDKKLIEKYLLTV